MNEYDETTGLPLDKNYLECNLPPLLTDSIERLQKSWLKHDKGEISTWDDDYCELQSNINICETGNIITTEQAWYLREKYLRISRNGEFL